MRNNVTTVYFDPRGFSKVSPLMQYDYGQKLNFENFEGLPDVFEVHFSNDQKGGKSSVVMGHKDSGVKIPDMYLTKGLDIWVWIYLHHEEDDGTTAYTIQIPVIRRSGAAIPVPTDDERLLITQVINELNTAVDRAEEAARRAEEAGGDAELLRAFENGEVTLDDGEAMDLTDVADFEDSSEGGEDDGAENV